MSPKVVLTLVQRKYARQLAGAPHYCKVCVVPGAKKPEFLGEPGYFTTPTGKTRIRYPNAYKYPKLYHRSTQRVEVGELYTTNLPYRKPIEMGYNSACSQGGFST